MKKFSKLLSLLLIVPILLTMSAFAQAPESTEAAETTEVAEIEETTEDAEEIEKTAEAPTEAANKIPETEKTEEVEKIPGTIYRQNFGTNATQLPITTDDVTLVIWKNFTFTVMDDLSECAAFQELEKRTGVKTEFVYPPSTK